MCVSMVRMALPCGNASNSRTRTRDWELRVACWSKTAPLLNDWAKEYFIPLSNDIQLNPEGHLPGGCYIDITHMPALSSQEAAIFLVPQ